MGLVYGEEAITYASMTMQIKVVVHHLIFVDLAIADLVLVVAIGSLKKLVILVKM